MSQINGVKTRSGAIRPSLHEDHGIIPSSVNPQNSNNVNNNQPVNPQNSNNVNINSAARQEPALSPPSVSDQMTEFTKFLVKKDLLYVKTN